MSLKNLICNYAAYNVWANQELVNWLSSKPEILLAQESPSSYSSILKTLNHIWGTEEYWYSKICNTDEFVNRYTVQDLNAEEIFAGLIHRSKELHRALMAFTEEELLKKIKVVSPWFECDLARYEYAQHASNHSTYHRGQVITISRCVGITGAPMTDYNAYNIGMAMRG